MQPRQLSSFRITTASPILNSYLPPTTAEVTYLPKTGSPSFCAIDRLASGTAAAPSDT